MKKRKTTEEEYQQFCDEVSRLVKLFELCDWNVYFEFEDFKNNGIIACVIPNMIGRVANFKLNKRICDDDARNIKGLALHEVIHLLFSEITQLGESRYITADEWNAAVERTAVRLENILPRFIT
jgi:hypothetical protein